VRRETTHDALDGRDVVGADTRHDTRAGTGTAWVGSADVSSSAPIPDQSDTLRAAVRYGVLGLLALTVLGAVIATLAAGLPGLWGALIGAALGGGFILTTALSISLTAKFPATMAGAVLLGGWLLKMLLAIVVLAVLGDMDFYSRTALAAVVVASLVLVLGAEVYGVVRTKAPYVDDPAGDKSAGDKGSDAA
jgi:hypothetical protein